MSRAITDFRVRGHAVITEDLRVIVRVSAAEANVVVTAVVVSLASPAMVVFITDCAESVSLVYFS